MFVLTLIGAAAAAGLACVRRIPEGHAYTLRRLGGHMRTIGAGTHIVVPVVERVAHKIRLLGNIVELGKVESALSDGAYGGQVFYQVIDAERADAVIDDVGELVRGCLPSLLAGSANEDASARNKRLKADLNQQLRDRGLLITRVQIAHL
jgi:regulator of protease activity HflC (stomatin/prohibitin superfamily)